MNSWAKIGLSALGVAVVAGIYYGDDFYSKKEAEQKKVESKAIAFETKDVRRFVVNNENGEFVFERGDANGDWKMIQPQAVKPDADAVNNLLNSVQGLSVESEIPDTDKVVKMSPDEASKFGLAKPRISFEVTLEDKKTKKLFVGDDLKVGSESGGNFVAVSVYAVNPERKDLMVISSSIVNSAKKKFEDFRTKVAGDFKTSDVTRFVVSKTGGTAVELKKDKEWRVAQPRDVLADSNNAGLYLDRFAKLHVNNVTEKKDLTDTKLSAMSLNPPSATVTFYGKDAALQEFKLGLTKDKIYVTMADGAVGTVDLGQWSDLVPEFKYFRDRRVMRDVPLADVLAIQTKSGKTYQKENGTWYKTQATLEATSTPDAKGTPAAARAESSEAGRLFSDWEFLTADDVIEGPEAQNLATYGLDKPVTTFEFTFKADVKHEPEKILVGSRVPKDEKKVYVKRSGNPAIFVVETTWMDSLQKLDEKSDGAQAKNDKK